MESRNSPPTIDAQSLDAVHTISNDPRRRRIVDALSGRDPPVATRELAAAFASRESDSDSETPTDASAEDIAAVLHHVHLPKLAAVDVIDYDAEGNEITGIRTEALAASLDAVSDLE